MGIKHHGVEFTAHPNGSRCFRTPGPFNSVAKVEDCPCEDGVRRTVHATAEADTFFTIPACTYVAAPGTRSKTVGGFLTMDEDGWRFTATGKNAGLIKPTESST